MAKSSRYLTLFLAVLFSISLLSVPAAAAGHTGSIQTSLQLLECDRPMQHNVPISLSTQGYFSPNTGDTDDMPMWVIFISGAIALITCIIIYRVRRN